MLLRFFVFLITFFSSFHALAAQCSAVFPGPQTFAAGSVEPIENGVTCNGGSCDIEDFTRVTPFPSISASGDFNSTTITDGVYEHNGWGLGEDAVVTFSGSGTAVIYFNDSDVVISKNADINKNGNPANVLIVAKGKLKIEEGAEINAFIYADGSETNIEKNSVINGAIAAKEKLILKENSTFNYSPIDLSSLDSHGFCDAGTAAPLMLHYLFNEGSGQTVADSSGNGRIGTLGSSNSVESNDATFTCEASGYYMDFDRSTNQHIQSPSFAPPQDGSVAFWLKVPSLPSARQRIFGFNDGWEIRWESDDVMYLDINKSGGNSSVRTSSAINAADVVDKWMHVAVVSSSTNDEWSVYLNGVLDNSGSESLSSQSTNKLTVGGSTWRATSEHLDGSIEDFRLYSGLLTASDVAQLASSAPTGCNAVKHYLIEHDGNGITCAPESVQIMACTDANCTATDTTNNDTVTFDVSNTSGQVINQAVTLNNGIATTSFNYTNTSDPAVLSLTEDYTCSNASSGNIGLVGDACQVAFSISGFVFNVPNQTSCNISGDVEISAVKADDITQACIPTFQNETKSLIFWTTYSSPATGSEQVRLQHDTAEYILGISQASANIVPIDFDVNGKGRFNVTYDDAGLLNLNTRFVENVNGANLVMEGSDTFVNVPAKLNVKAIGPDANCNSANLYECNVYKKAGETFDMSVSATCANDTVTKNFQLDNIALSVSTLEPLSGNPVSIAIDNFNMVDFDDGEHVVENQTVSEVGVFTVTATPTINSYFGETVPSGTSANIGRFIPDKFVLTSSNVTHYLAASNMTYMEQPSLGITYDVQAQNVSGDVTLNYVGNYNNSTVSLSAENNNSGTDVADRLNGFTGAWSGGTYTSNPGFGRFSRLSNEVDGPFDNLLFGIKVGDSDGVELQALDMNADESTDCTVLKDCNAKNLSINEGKIRFGRWVIENVYGPETSAISIPMRLEYYDGTEFVVNTLDSVTGFEHNLMSVNNNDISPSTTSVTETGTFSSGLSDALLLSAPSQGDQGDVLLDYNLSSMPWLQYDWDDTDSMQNGPFNGNPDAIATFGLFRGNDRIIYWREIHQ